MVYPRIHDPVIYEWELKEDDNDDLDRFDYPKVWPSPEQLHVEFSVLAAINAVTATTVILLIVALLRSKKVRSNVFNMYLLCIAIPDFLVSFLCLFTCALSAPISQFYSEWMCGFQSFYLNWAFCSNTWLNGVVVFQIHRMLRHSQIRRRYIPPSRSQAFGHAAVVYTYASLWGFLCGFNLKFLPHSTHLYYGFACMPMEYNRASTLFFYLVYLPCTLGAPLVYALYVSAHIISHKLLPPTGKRRALAMFLLRLCFLYFGIWLPFLILFLVGNFVPINTWIHWAGAAISHLQGLISVLFCLTNKDIQRSFLQLVTCQAADNQEHDFDWENTAEMRSGASAEQRRTLQLSLESASMLLRAQSWIAGRRSSSSPQRLSSLQREDSGTEGPKELLQLQQDHNSASMEMLKVQVNRYNSRYNHDNNDNDNSNNNNTNHPEADKSDFVLADEEQGQRNPNDRHDKDKDDIAREQSPEP